uniref:GGDEF domain-containing protein n=1 Tax=Kineococcus sp. SYSU DK005 TaxID=3383126 RepID=UPI003D7F0682
MSRPRRLRAAAGAVVASVVLCLPVMLLLPPGSGLVNAVYVVPVALAVALMAVAVRRVPAERRRPWRWLLAAQVTYLAGEVLYAVADLAGVTSWPTPADALHLAAYVPVTVGVLALNRQRGGRGHRGGLLDASIVTLSAAVLFGVFVVLPVATDSTQPALARLVSTVYPLADVLWVYLLARMVTGPGARTTAFWLLVAAGGLLLTADVGLTFFQHLTGGLGTPVWMNVLWQACYVLYALAACSESAPRLSEKKPADGAAGGLTVPRLLVLAVAAVLPSAVLVWSSATGRATPEVWLGTGSVLLVSLVVVRVWDLLQQVRSQAVQLAALARTDPLTGAANRRTWDHELSRACASAQRGGTSFLVALLDLDRFKAFNDSRGHQAGDELLVSATAAWTRALGARGTLARWGGEEFAVLLPWGPRGGAPALAGGAARRAGVPLGPFFWGGGAGWVGG